MLQPSIERDVQVKQALHWRFAMDALHAQSSTYIDLPAAQVFDFLCHQAAGRAELTPMEDRIIEGGRLNGVGFVSRMRMEIAARQLEYSVWCTEFEPSRRLACQFDGDIRGDSIWCLSPDGKGTDAELMLDIALPRWAPSYLRDDTIGARWGELLANQCLSNVKTACTKQAGVNS